MNPAKMSIEADRVLEWINLVLGTYCVGVSAFMWSTSPRLMHGDSPIVSGSALLTLCGLPILLVTSGVLLSTNRRRAVFGFGAFLLSVIALSRSTAVFN